MTRTASATRTVPQTPTATGTGTAGPIESPTDATPPATSPTASLPVETASMTPTPSPTPPAVTCTGDCDDSGDVTIDELVLGVRMALGGVASRCPALDANLSSAVEINELVDAVGHALHGCP